MKKLYRIKDMALGGRADQRLVWLGFSPADDVIEVEESDGVYATFQAWLTPEQVQVLAEEEAIYELIQAR